MEELLANHPNSFVLIPRDEIQARVEAMKREIEADFPSWGVKDLVIIQVLKGAKQFCEDLRVDLQIVYELDSIELSSYGSAQVSSGKVMILKEPTTNLRGKAVLIVEDVVDSGLSMSEVKQYIKMRGAAVVKVVTFLDKPTARKIEFVPDFIGKSIGSEFVVGYGMDFAQKYRDMPDICVLKD